MEACVATAPNTTGSASNFEEGERKLRDVGTESRENLIWWRASRESRGSCLCASGKKLAQPDYLGKNPAVEWENLLVCGPFLE